MKIGDEFSTCVYEGKFVISITQESDISKDGGHTFEDVTNSIELSRAEAVDLIDALEDFLVPVKK